jgi:hypothetical protein
MTFAESLAIAGAASHEAHADRSDQKEREEETDQRHGAGAP